MNFNKTQKSELFASADKAIKTIVPYYDSLVQSIHEEQNKENELSINGTKTLSLTTDSGVFVGLYDLLKDYADMLPKKERGRYAVAIEGLMILAFNGGRVLGWKEQAGDTENTEAEGNDSDSLDEYLKTGFCGIGTNKTKRFLGKKIDSSDNRAEVLKCALSAEKMSVDLLKCQESYKLSRVAGYNFDKECWRLIGIARSYGCYGGIIRDNSNKETPIIAIAELPSGETVAFRCAEDDMWKYTPKYEKSWDNDFNSNFAKIERNILELYQDEIKQRYPDSK